MKFLFDFILGLFTRHLGTKITALLLSVVALFIVHGQLTGTSAVETFRLEFQLADELGGRYMLLDRQVVFEPLKLRGNQSAMDQFTNQLAGQEKAVFTLKPRDVERFLGKQRITVDREFLQEIKFLPSSTEVLDSPPRPDVLRIVERGEATLELDLAEDHKERVKIKEKHDWEGTEEQGRRVAHRFAPSKILLEGPKAALPPGRRVLEVEIDPVDGFLRNHTGDGKVSVGIRGLRWKKAGVDDTLLRYIDVRVGDTLVVATDLTVTMEYTVVPRKEPRTADLPIRFQYDKENEGLLKEYSLEGPTGCSFQAGAFEKGICRRFALEVEAGLTPEDLEQLVLVLDVENCTKTPETLAVPVHLGLKKGAPPELLDRVRMKLTEGFTGEPAIIFRPKKS